MLRVLKYVWTTTFLVVVVAGFQYDARSAITEPFADVTVSQIDTANIRYSRETDNYYIPRDPKILAHVFNSEVVINNPSRVTAIVAAMKRVRILGHYNFPLDVTWGIELRGSSRVRSIYLDRTLNHAYINGQQYVIDKTFGTWLLRRYGCLRNVALNAS